MNNNQTGSSLCKQKTTNCLQAQICATLLTHSASETEMLCVLVVKLVVKLKKLLA